jgi:hypothetical protein
MILNDEEIEEIEETQEHWTGAQTTELIVGILVGGLILGGLVWGGYNIYKIRNARAWIAQATDAQLNPLVQDRTMRMDRAQALKVDIDTFTDLLRERAGFDNAASNHK